MSSKDNVKDSVVEGAVADLDTGSIDLDKMTKEEVVSKFRRAGSDTGSPEVQIALITQRLKYLSRHFASNPKDNHSRRGMMRAISRRKGLLQYLKTSDVERYKSTLSALGLRK